MMCQCNIIKELIDDLENLVHDNLESIREEVGDLKNLVDDDWRQLQTWKQSIGVWVCELEEDLAKYRQEAIAAADQMHSLEDRIE